MPPTDACALRWPIQLITGLRIAEMSQRQGEGEICTKNGSYCEKEKKSGGEGGWGGQGRCERRSEAFVKIQKKIFFFFWGGGGGGVGLMGGGGGQGGCELRSEAFVKIQKKNFFWGGGGGRVGGSGWGGSGWM